MGTFYLDPDTENSNDFTLGGGASDAVDALDKSTRSPSVPSLTKFLRTDGSSPNTVDLDFETDTIPTGSVVSSVKVHWFRSGGENFELTVTLKDHAASTLQSSTLVHTQPPSASLPSAWYSMTYSGTISQTQMNGLNVVIEFENTAGSEETLYALYIEVTYAEAFIDDVGPGRTYSDLDAWLTARKAVTTDLVSNQQLWIAEVYGTIPDETLTLSGVTTSSDYYIRIRAADGFRHLGRPDFGAKLQPGSTSPIVTVQSQYVVFEGLIFETTLGTGGTGDGVQLEESNAFIDRCIFVARGGTGDLLRAVGTTKTGRFIKDCLFLGETLHSSAACIELSGATNSNVDVINCSILKSGGVGVRISSSSGTCTFNAENTLIQGCTGVEWAKAVGGGTETYSGDTNCSSTNTNRPGGSSITRTFSECRVVSNAAGQGDPHLLDASPLRDAGANSSTLVGTIWTNPEDRDIDSELRDGTNWSIGCDQHNDECLYVSDTRLTDAAFKIVKHERGVNYDIASHHRFGRDLRWIDAAVTEDSDQASADSSSIATAQGNVVGTIVNVAGNSTFKWWQRGTSFTSVGSQFTADLWKKTSQASVVQGSARGFSDQSLTLKTLSAGTTVRVEQFFYLDRHQSMSAIFATRDLTSMSFSAGIHTSSGSSARVGIRSGSGDPSGSYTYSSYHTGGGTEERLTTSKSIASSDTWVSFVLELTTPASINVSADFFDTCLAAETYTSLVFTPVSEIEDLARILRYYQVYDFWVPTSEQGAGDNMAIVDSLVISMPDTTTQVLSVSSSVPTGVATETNVVEPQGAATNLSVELEGGAQAGSGFIRASVGNTLALSNPDNTEWKSISIEAVPTQTEF